MITQNKLKEFLDYNSETGEFRWDKIGPGRRINKKVGYLRKDGYKYIRFLGVNYLAHRLVWFYIHGNFPKHQIDHINGIRSDNRIINLRDVNGSINMRNQVKRKNNISGHKGVSWHKASCKWRVQINDNSGNQITLGYFDDISEAVVTRKQREIKYEYSERHGK